MRLSESWQIVFKDKLRKLMTFTATVAWKLHKSERGKKKNKKKKKGDKSIKDNVRISSLRLASFLSSVIIFSPRKINLRPIPKVIS